MSLSKRYAAACRQMLKEEDLSLPEEVAKELDAHGFSARFAQGDGGELYLKLFGYRHYPLTEVVPLLKNIGLHVHSEISYRIENGERGVEVSRYRIETDEEMAKKIDAAAQSILSLVGQMLCDPRLPNTPLLRLALLESLIPRELELLDAWIGYENQLVLSFNETTITQVLIKHHPVARALVEHFHLRFDPEWKRNKTALDASRHRIEDLMQPITHITEDRVIRTLYEIVDKMLRTNYYLQKETIAFKLPTDAIESVAKALQPRIEAYVHHHRLAGVHLRMGPVSRGGIRWSDRFEDYRVEVRSLMLTQEGKNAVIVPSGAKGGFIIRLPKEEIDRDRFKAFYESYIDALLDLVDNQEEGKAVTPPKIVRYDGDDTYFVVAADKGTAHMSDTANAIALKRGFWLGDAFASGGSHGYSHKDLGITAKGALRSVERHFIERGVNFYEEPISVVGIGSMNGDVFGNGMLASRKFRLLAAVSHREIFVDPDPDPDIAYQERLRLFHAEKGGWSAYDRDKISEGGGVFSRDEKAIALTPQMQKLFHTSRTSMSGEEMVRAVLKIKADMLFNGGVGTYVKASWESNLDVGDKANENVRVDASELRVSAVCEGGNLGFTLSARIEYAKHGGFINLDAIDNSAGVNTSDYEVNLKITLGALVRKGQIDEESRLETLQKQVDMVVNRVLWTNHHQSLAISLDRRRSANDLVPFLQTIEILERELPVFSRKQFHIPKEEKIAEVLSDDGALVRPVLGTLLSYSKIFLKRILLQSDVPDESFAQEYLLKYFPKTFSALFEDEILQHPLRREIAVTVMANRIIDSAGVTFISDYDELGEAGFVQKIKSYLICNQLFGCNDIRYEIFRHEYEIPAPRQYELLFAIEEALDFSVGWMLRHLSGDQIHAPTLLRYRTEIGKLFSMVPEEKHTPIFGEASEADYYFHHLPFMKFAVAAIILHERSHRRFDETAKLMYLIIKRLHINEIMEALTRYRPKDKDEHTIKRQLEAFIEYAVTSLSEKVTAYQRKNERVEEAFENYLKDFDERYRDVEESYDRFKDEEVRTKELEKIAILVNNLMQLTLENKI